MRNLQLVRSLVELAARLQSSGQIIVRGRVIRIPCDYRLEFLHCCGPIMGVGGQPGQRAVSFHQSRSKLHGLLEFSGSQRFVTSSSQQNSQLKMRGSMIWIQLQNLAEGGFGLSGTIRGLRQGQAQLVMGLGEVGTERDRLLQLADGGGC